MGTTTQNVGKLGYLYDIYGTITGAGIARSPVRGLGTAFNFSASIIGKTLKIQDSGATTTTLKTITFTRANLGITGGSNTPPTLAQVVAALNSVLTEAAPTVASAGPDGRLVLTGVGNLTISGDGTANTEFGWPDNGVSIKHAAAALEVQFPTSFLGPGYTELLYQMVPRSLVGYQYTAATGVQSLMLTATLLQATWTPSTRLLSITGGAAGQVHVVLEY